MWPTNEDLKHLTDEQIANFRIEQIQFWNNYKIDEELYNLAFRLFGCENMKSSVFCSHEWKQSPEGSPEALITVDLKNVTKIAVYCHKR